MSLNRDTSQAVSDTRMPPADQPSITRETHARCRRGSAWMALLLCGHDEPCWRKCTCNESEMAPFGCRCCCKCMSRERAHQGDTAVRILMLFARGDTKYRGRPPPHCTCSSNDLFDRRCKDDEKSESGFPSVDDRRGGRVPPRVSAFGPQHQNLDRSSFLSLIHI